MSLNSWNDAKAVGLAPMDDIHHEFVDLLAELVAAEDAHFLDRLDALAEHTVLHFAQESVWMAESEFPPVHCHEDEHKKVLQVVGDVRERVAGGDIALGRTLARELMPWFDNHAATMDAALSGHIKLVGYDAERDLVVESAELLAAEQATAQPQCQCQSQSCAPE